MPTIWPRSHPQAVAERDQVAGERLASQPTLSRFENGAGRGALYRIRRELAERVIERDRRRWRVGRDGSRPTWT